MATLTQTLSGRDDRACSPRRSSQKVEIVSAAEEEAEEPAFEDADEDLVDAAAGGDDHGPRRPRQDLAAGRDPRDRGRRGRGRRHHPAHRRLPGPPQRQDDHLPRHARPRGVHGDARARRQGHRPRRDRRRGRRRRDAADRSRRSTTRRRPTCRSWSRSTRSTSEGANPDRVRGELGAAGPHARGLGRRDRSSATSPPRPRRGSTTCSR